MKADRNGSCFNFPGDFASVDRQNFIVKARFINKGTTLSADDFIIL